MKTRRKQIKNKKTRRKLIRGGAKIKLFDDGDIAELKEILKVVPASETEIASIIDEFIKEFDAKQASQSGPVPAQGPTQSTTPPSTQPSNPTSASQKHDYEVYLYNLSYKFYPFLLKRLDELNKELKNAAVGEVAKIKKQQLVLLKTARKIELLKKPLWLDSLLKYLGLIAASASDLTFDGLDTFNIFGKTADDYGKMGAKITMNVYKDLSNDKKVTSDRCNADDDSNMCKHLDYRIRYYNEDPIRDANHMLNKMFFTDYILQKKSQLSSGVVESDLLGKPIAVQENEILYSQATNTATTNTNNTNNSNVSNANNSNANNSIKQGDKNQIVIDANTLNTLNLNNQGNKISIDANTLNALNILNSVNILGNYVQ
jgi:hypothetical protein